MNVTSRVARMAVVALLSLFCIAIYRSRVRMRRQVARQARRSTRWPSTMPIRRLLRKRILPRSSSCSMISSPSIPTSALLNYIYPLYYKNYGGQKNFPKTIEYCGQADRSGR